MSRGSDDEIGWFSSPCFGEDGEAEEEENSFWKPAAVAMRGTAVVDEVTNAFMVV